MESKIPFFTFLLSPKLELSRTIFEILNFSDGQRPKPKSQRVGAMLPRSTINAIKTKLDNALSAKDPGAIATAIDLPPFPKSSSAGASVGGGGGSEPQHQLHLKIDGVDWSNALNLLLDAHLAIQSVSPVLIFCTLMW